MWYKYFWLKYIKPSEMRHWIRYSLDKETKRQLLMNGWVKPYRYYSVTYQLQNENKVLVDAQEATNF